MAPEVALGKPYNEKCDVYSFAILLWEMVTMNQPYQLLGMKALQTRVWSDDGERKRPYIPNDDARGNKHKDAHLWKTAGGNVKLLLQKSWCADLPARNSMAQVYAILRRECIRARKGDDSGLEHNRRRSTFVFRPSPTGALHNNNNNKEGSLRRTGGALLQRMTSTRTSKANKIPPSSRFLAPTANTAKAATMTAATDGSMQQKTASSPSTLLPKAAAVSAAGGPKKTTKFAMDKDECSV
jgi:Protein tyrosine and serine/threonine kinase